MERAPTRRKSFLIFLFGLVLSISGGCTTLTGQSGNVGSTQLQSQAKQGDALSQYRLGILYTAGQDQDYKEAAKWFKKAAHQGNQDAQYMLGITYYVGRGLPRDYTKAREWFRKAADQGQARAQYQLGEIYMNGRGVQKEPAWAALWYGKAAEQAHAEAQFSLAIVFARGLGLSVNPVRSCQWLILADQSGYATAAAVRGKICMALSRERQARAKKLAANWRVRSYPPYQDPATIRYIQFRLQQLGYDSGYVDGVNGEQTRATVRRYLADAGLDGETVSMESLVTRLRRHIQSP